MRLGGVAKSYSQWAPRPNRGTLPPVPKPPCPEERLVSQTLLTRTCLYVAAAFHHSTPAEVLAVPYACPLLWIRSRDGVPECFDERPPSRSTIPRSGKPTVCGSGTSRSA